MRCPKCKTYNPPEEQLTYCKKCGTELRVVCPRCSADNPGHAEFCGECGLELHPDRGHERAAGIRKDDTTTVAGVSVKKPTISSGVLAGGVIALLIVWVPIFFALKKRAQNNHCQSNLKQIAQAMRAYARDNGGHAPSGADWNAALLPYLRDRDTLSCPSRPGKIGYAFNLSLNEVPLAEVSNAGTVIAFFESDAKKNTSGTQSLWLKDPAHSRGNNLVFADGTIRQTRNVPPDLFWQVQYKRSVPVSPAPPETPGATPGTLPGGPENTGSPAGMATGVPETASSLHSPPAPPAGTTSANPPSPVVR